MRIKNQKYPGSGQEEKNTCKSMHILILLEIKQSITLTV